MCFNSCVSISSFQFIHVNSFVSIHACQVLHFNSFISIHSWQFIRFNSFMSSHSCQLIHGNSFMSCFTSFQLTMNCYKPYLFFETSAPARAGHCLVSCLRTCMFWDVDASMCKDKLFRYLLNKGTHIYIYIYIHTYIHTCKRAGPPNFGCFTQKCFCGETAFFESKSASRDFTLRGVFERFCTIGLLL